MSELHRRSLRARRRRLWLWVIAGVFLVLPGENELESLAEGALSVLRGEERARTYPTG